jgi:SAM-dependent methyltransferase
MTGEAGTLQRVVSALMKGPFFYYLVQTLAGGQLVIKRVRDAAGPLPSGRVLDVGGASGGAALALGVRPSCLVCLDYEFLPLADRRRVASGALGVQGDASRLPFIRKAFDLTLCTAVAHHLDDRLVSAAIPEIARVTSGTFLFFDPTREPSRWISRLLWRFDRGRHPRSEGELRPILERSFHARITRAFGVLHRYFLFVGEPRL